MRKDRLLLFSLLIVCSIQVMGQSKSITGKILDSAGHAMPGATIRVKNAAGGTSSGQDGLFTINAKTNAILLISAVGFGEKQVAIGNKDYLEIVLSRNEHALEEVVVTALGVKREKRNLTFSSQELKGDELVKSKEPNLLNAITGKVAGVQVTSASGMPGSSSRIVIRGTTSLYGDNQALIVIDGVPVSNEENDATPNGGSGTNRLADIDPTIIESMNVLKGAAATALYGSAGARGVVLITTKKGSAGSKPTITLSSGVSFEKAIFPERQYKYAQGDNNVYYDGDVNKTSSSWGPEMDTLTINGVKAQAHNPLKEFFKTGVTNNNSISIAGGNTQSNYFMSYSYLDQKGIIPKTTYDRHTLFSKYSAHIFDKLTASFQLSYSYASNDKVPEGYGLESPLWTIFTAPVSYNLKPSVNPDGSQRLFRYSRDNPYWILDNVLNTSVVNRFLPIVNLSYTPTSWLSVTERLGADIYTDRQNYHVNMGDVTYTDGYLYNNNENFRQYNHDFIIQVKKDFGKLNASLLVGNNVMSKYYETMTANGQGLAKAGYYNMASASTVAYAENSYESRKVGFYGQADLEYARMLLLSVTGRYDGSSVLSQAKQFYPYGSAALGFIFSEVLPDNLRKIINFGKVRISYAKVGNDNVLPYATTTPYLQVSATNLNAIEGAIVGMSFPYNGNNGFLINYSLGNPYLKNELQTEKEAGLEMKFLNNRIGFEASYFDRKMTNGLAQGVTLANSTGYASTTINSAILQTKGLEILLNVTPVRSKNFSWDVLVNYTKMNNKVLNIGEGLTLTNIGQTYAAVGQPYGVLYGTKFARTSNGQLKIDASGLPYADANAGIIGNISPDWLGGITNTFRYKQVGLSFFFDTKQGGQLVNSDDIYGFYYGTSKATENRAARTISGISDVTGKANTVQTGAEAYFRRLNSVTESGVQGDSYIKLRNVSLSYSVGKSLLAGTPFKEATLALTGRNLWIHKSKDFTGSDPEVNSFGSGNGSIGTYSFSTPTARSFDCTLKIVF